MSGEGHRYIAVDGPPGSGVTALSRALAKALNATLVQDPAPQSPFLDDYAKDPKRFAFQAQVYCLLTRYRQQVELAQTSLFASPAIVCDYLYARDPMYAEILLSEEEFKLYTRIHELLQERIPSPDLFVYLTADVGVLKSRIRNLIGSSERVIKMNVIEGLAKRMDRFVFSYDKGPMLIINTSEFQIVEQKQHIDDLVAVIRKTHAGKHHYRPM